MAQRLGPLVGGFLFAPEDHHHAALRVELDHHVRALVRYPDVVILIDLHRVRERPGIQMMADLANEFAVGAELQKLCGARPIGGAGGVAAREDEDVSLGVHRHARDFAEIDVRREFQKIGNRLVPDLGRLLSKKRNTEQER